MVSEHKIKMHQNTEAGNWEFSVYKLNIQQALKAGTIAAGVGAVINAIVFFIGQAAGIITDNVFVQPHQPLTIVPVLISSVLPAIIGSLVFFYLKNSPKMVTKISES